MFLVVVLVFFVLFGFGIFILLIVIGCGGVCGGYIVLVGLLVGDQILMWLVLVGVVVLFKVNLLVFYVVQYLGVVYLVWVGIGLLCILKYEGGDVGLICMQLGCYFQQVILVSLFNLKVILFYMVFLLLFIDFKVYQGIVIFVVLVGIILVVSIVYCLMLIGVGNLVCCWLIQYSWISDVLCCVVGLFLVGFGIWLGLNG